MNKKYTNSILIIFLIAIWGSVIYKYFVKKTVVLEDNAMHSSSMAIDYTIAKDTFVLNLNNRDPFKASKNRRGTQSGSTAPANSISNRTSKLTKTFVWPNIAYYGFVKSSQNKTKKALVKVNGRLYRKRENETIDDLKLIKAYSDSIIVGLNSAKKTIKRK